MSGDQQDLFGWRPPPPAIPEADPSADFDGETYEAEFDRERLTGQLRAVYDVVHDGAWRTLAEIAAAMTTPASEASISARLRDLRKEKFGGFTVERRARGDRHRGLFEYRVIEATQQGVGT